MPSKRATAPRKRKASSRITDEDFVGAESNAVTKRLKQSADATRAAAAKHQKRQPSVVDLDEDTDDDAPLNNPPKNPHSIIEAANGSDDVVMLDNLNAAPELHVEDVETAEEQRSESN